MKRFAYLLTAVPVMMALEACSNITEDLSINQAGVEVVAFEDELPECTDENEDRQVLVLGESFARICVDGEWLAVEDDGDFSCEMVELADKSGLKIVCNGDSIGVALNDVIGSGCTLAQYASSAVAVTCGDSTAVYKLGTDGPSADASVTDLDESEVSLDSLTGYSQKGPFLKGSRVFLYELDNGKTLKQTNGNFTSYITTDNGRYKFTSRNVRPYAIIIVDGFYRNEVTGTASDQSIRLQALCDVRKHRSDGANVNILTHMEYERVYYLVTQKGYDFEEAKKTAQKEVFKAFGIELSETKDAESLNVFGTSEGDAALLAISVLVQSDLSVPDMMVLLTEISNEMAEDGEWSDTTGNAESLKARIADWAMETDNSGELDDIYNHVAAWNLGPVPYFQDYVRDYWRKIYGLEVCTDDLEGVVVGTENYASSYSMLSLTRFICESGRWRVASDLQKDTYKWGKCDEGEIRDGSITGEKYICVEKEGSWRGAYDVEIALGGCTAAIEKDDSKNAGYFDENWYICKNRIWEISDDVTVDTRAFPAGSDGAIAEGAITHAKYKYDEVLGAWTHISEADTSTAIGLFVCTNKHVGEYHWGKDDVYYICDNSPDVVQWRIATDFERNTEGAVCDAANVGKVIHGVVQATNMYYCTESGWKSMMDEWDWSIPKEARLNPDFTGYDTIIDGRDGQSYKIVTIGEQVWMAENLNYQVSGSRCYDDVAEHCNVTGRLYTWAIAVGKSEKECGQSRTCNLTLPVQGVCPDGWHLPSADEWQTLVDYVGTKVIAGFSLKSLSGWIQNGNGIDSVGFSALPAGYMNTAGEFGYGGHAAFFWTSTESAIGALEYAMEFSHKEVVGNHYSKINAMSVRCVKNSKTSSNPEGNGSSDPGENGGSDPEGNGGSDPEGNGGSDPEGNGGSDPEGNGGSDPEGNGGSDPEGNGGSDPEGNGGSDPEGNGGSDPEGNGGSDPEGNGGSDPEGNGGSDPEGNGGSDPEGNGGSDPEGNGGSDPEGNGGSDPEGNGGSDPEGNGGSDPEGNGGSDPEGNGGSDPEGNGGSDPEGNGESDPEGNGGSDPEGNGGSDPEGNGSSDPGENGGSDPEGN
jgi:uncharacterized protein (TIGR02145 family)